MKNTCYPIILIFIILPLTLRSQTSLRDFKDDSATSNKNVKINVTISDGELNSGDNENNGILKFEATYDDSSILKFSTEDIPNFYFDSKSWKEDESTAELVLTKALAKIIKGEKFYTTYTDTEKKRIDSLIAAYTTTNKSKLNIDVIKYLATRQKGLKGEVGKIMESLQEETAGFIRLKGDEFTITDSVRKVINKETKQQEGNLKIAKILNSGDESKATDSLDLIRKQKFKLVQLDWAIKDNKLFLRDVLIQATDSKKKYKSLGTINYPICLLSEFENQYIPISIDDYDFNINVDDIIEYVSPKKTIQWGFFVKDEGWRDATVDSVTVIKRRQFPDILNASVFYQLSQAIGDNGLSSNTDNNSNAAQHNAQIEINLKIPMFDINKYRGLQTLSDFNMALNISPLGKSSPYYLFDTTLPGKRYISPFELLRNYYFFNQLSLPVLKFNKSIKMQLHSIVWDAGYKLYKTKIRNVFEAADSTFKVDYDNKNEVQIIGPYTSLRYESRVNDIFGLDIELGANFLNVRNGVNNSFFYYRQKNGVAENTFNPWIYTINWGVNVYLRPFAQSGNPSGLIVRYRQFYQFGNKTDIPYELMIGYAINLKSILRY